MGAPYGALGIRRLIDQNQRFMRAGLTVYLRRKNFDDSGSPESEIGSFFVPTVTGGQLPATGTTDYLIAPPPSIKDLNFFQLQQAIASGVQLRAGSKKVIVSHTWVQAMQAYLGLADPRQVWEDGLTIGLISDNALLSIRSIAHEDVYGTIMDWHLTVDAPTVPIDPPSNVVTTVQNTNTGV